MYQRDRTDFTVAHDSVLRVVHSFHGLYRSMAALRRETASYQQEADSSKVRITEGNRLLESDSEHGLARVGSDFFYAGHLGVIHPESTGRDQVSGIHSEYIQVPSRKHPGGTLRWNNYEVYPGPVRNTIGLIRSCAHRIKKDGTLMEEPYLSARDRGFSSYLNESRKKGFIPEFDRERNAIRGILQPNTIDRVSLIIVSNPRRTICDKVEGEVLLAARLGLVFEPTGPLDQGEYERTLYLQTGTLHSGRNQFDEFVYGFRKGSLSIRARTQGGRYFDDSHSNILHQFGDKLDTYANAMYKEQATLPQKIATVQRARQQLEKDDVKTITGALGDLF